MGTNESAYVIVRKKLGSGTGDIFYQTIDGRWWEKYRGQRLQTGEEIRKLKVR
jgi:hypothetical protein